MKKPDIAKRLLPLLDIMMLLLSFFIVLPHGIATNERTQIGDLQKSNQNLQQQLDYIQWHYDNRMEIGRPVKTLDVTLIDDKLYLNQEVIAEKDWERKIGAKVTLENINFIFIRIQDTPGENNKNYTRAGTIANLKIICRKLKMMFVEETKRQPF